MFIPPVVIAEPPQSLAPHQLLACAVLALAISDLVAANSSDGRRAQARAWLRSRDCDFWLHVAGLPPDRFRTALDRLIRADTGAAPAQGPHTTSRTTMPLRQSRRRELPTAAPAETARGNAL